MRLINDQLIEDTARSDRWFESIGTPSSDYQLGFTLGCNWAQQQIKPLFVLFGKECRRAAIFETMKARRMGSTGISKTTEELFELWMEEQNKKK